MASTPGVVVELLTLPDDVAPRWRDWYDRTCLGPRAALDGVIAARRFTGLEGSVRELGLYDVADVNVAHAPAWRVLGEKNVTGADHALRGAHAAHLIRQLYRRISSSVEAYQPDAKAEILHGAFFEVAAVHQDEFNDWYDTEHIPAELGIPGYLNARRFHGIDDTQRFLALYDVATLEAVDGPAGRQAYHSPWSDRVRAKLALRRERRLFRLERCLPGRGATIS